MLHSFYNRDIPAVVELMDKNCTWIGAYDAQYTHGIDAFIEATKAESQEAPIQFLEEEYGLIFHDKKYAAVYGRYTLSGEQEDGVVLFAKVRLTFVWKQVKDQLLAVHIHCADSKDIPLQYETNQTDTFSEKIGWFEYLRRIDDLSQQKDHILLKDKHGLNHTLLPMEIIYIKCNNKKSTIFTGTKDFVTNYTLRELEEICPFLQRIHKSYLVNTSYAQSIRRYTLTMHNGALLPISKERYMTLKRSLSTTKKK